MATGTPGTGAFAASAPMRSEFDDVEAGFDKMPLLTAGTAVVVNGAGTALVNTVGRFAVAGDFSTTGNFAVVLAASAAVTLALPALDGTLATLAGAETFSNKTFGSNNNMGTPTALVGTNITGTAAGLTAGNATTAAHATTADSATTATTATTVTTNANLTGVITSVGNATSIASQTGTGTKFVVDTSPTLVTPNIGTPSAGVLINATGLPISSGVTGLGTGVATALAVNIGSAGAFVTFNGAGGTPSSMTATNLTGTAAGLTAGTASAVAVGGITGLGTNVATALAVAVGNAGAFVTFNGAGGTPSSMTATNLTGTAAGLTAGTASAVAVGGITGLGTGVATALGINTGSVGAVVLLNGAGGTPSSINLSNATSLASAALPVGAQKQLVSNTWSTTSTTTSSTYAAIAAAATSITPATVTNKIRVQLSLMVGTNIATPAFFRLKRAGTVISADPIAGAYLDSSSNSTTGTYVIDYLDSPASTSSLSYTLEWKNGDNSNGVFINTNVAATITGISTMSLTEIVA